MEKNISFTIPMEKETLLKTADLLCDLAGYEKSAALPDAEPVLSPEAIAEEMGARIDETVAAAGAPAIEAATPELDKEGCPWDERIHASSKAFVADGTWRLKRGVDPELVKTVMLEIKRAFNESLLTPPPVVPVVEAPPVVAPAAVAATTYAQLIPRITAQAKAQILQANDVKDALANTGAFAAGVANLTDLAKPEHIIYVPLVAAELERVWATRA